MHAIFSEAQDSEKLKRVKMTVSLNVIGMALFHSFHWKYGHPVQFLRHYHMFMN